MLLGARQIGKSALLHHAFPKAPPIVFDPLLSLAASLSGQEINASQLGHEIRITPPTARRWLNLEELTLEIDGKLYPIEIKCKTTVNPQDGAEIKAFRATYPQQNVMAQFDYLLRRHLFFC